MAENNLSSENIDDYVEYDFSTIGEDEITLSEQQHGSFPLATIKKEEGRVVVEVFHEVFYWDHWIRNHSVKKFEKAFYNSFETLQIEGADRVESGVFDEDEIKVLLTWKLIMPDSRHYRDLKTTILKSVDQVLFETRLLLLEPKLPTGFKKFFLVNGSSYTVGVATFWLAFPLLCAGIFTLGTIKFDADKNSLYDDKLELSDSLKIKNVAIKNLKNNSDSALNILSHMPYDQMKLDTVSFRMVQTTIENAGAVLNLNK